MEGEREKKEVLTSAPTSRMLRQRSIDGHEGAERGGACGAGQDGGGREGEGGE